MHECAVARVALLYFRHVSKRSHPLPLYFPAQWGAPSMVTPAGSGGGGRGKKSPASNTGAAKPKRKPAAKKAAAGGAGVPKKPRATAKKADDPQLSLELVEGAAEVAAPRAAKKPAAPARKRPTAKPSAAPRAQKPAPPEAPEPRTQAAPTSSAREVRRAEPRPKPAPVVRVTIPNRIRLRDLVPKWRPWQRVQQPREPLPFVERALNWMRNAAMVAVVVASLLVMWGAAYALVNPPRTPLMWVRYWQGADEGRFVYSWKPFDELGHATLLAVVAAADPEFFDTGGLNPRAVRATLTHGDGLGAVRPTTLGNLTADHVFSWPSDGWASRSLENFFTLVVDVAWSKRRIAEVYANVAEFGPGLYGAEAAAQAYFAKPAKELSEAEAALLAACLASPADANPAAPNAALLANRDAIYARMQAMGGVERVPKELPRRDESE